MENGKQMRNNKETKPTQSKNLPSPEKDSTPSYTAMIAQAIMKKQYKKATLAEIYEYLSSEFDLTTTRGSGWRNCVRHTLSLNECFVKLYRPENGRSCNWTVHPSYFEAFDRGDYRKRRNKNKMNWVNNGTYFDAVSHLPKQNTMTRDDAHKCNGWDASANHYSPYSCAPYTYEPYYRNDFNANKSDAVACTPSTRANRNTSASSSLHPSPIAHRQYTNLENVSQNRFYAYGNVSPCRYENGSPSKSKSFLYSQDVDYSRYTDPINGMRSYTKQ